MPWPEYIQEQFATVTPFGEVDETEYYGPYNGLLFELFPSPEHFMIVPQYKRPRYPQSADFSTIFTVQHRKQPVFFIEIKPSGHIRKLSERVSADQQMRERFDALSDEVNIPTLYGVSVLGTKLCVYTYETETSKLTPGEIERDPKYVTDRAPAGRWNLDIMESGGEQRMREIVAHVKEMCGRF
ncbi:hypothetical protein M422DRAFT_39007 [Sphaerobolus stellatus SS14]|uniref:Uncharacterized protein n=1 Tax=Sphaerobolus stellatus (strain SS14) TaxID=990650 RepID=A0A0C9UHA2_SPHS4|nr:hypothetical protein M422DRAFT_39007 [Sphaerobolus stellatus SS14]